MSAQFTSPRPNLVVSDSGFSVEILGRTGTRYTEGRRTVKIDSEVLNKPHAMALYRLSIKRWEPPHEGDALGVADRSRIIENINLAFQSQGWELQVMGTENISIEVPFTSPRPNLFVSDLGFSVEVLGRTRLRYTRRDRVATLHTEALAEPGAMRLQRSSIRQWDPPHEAEAIGEADRLWIEDAIRQTFRSQGWKLEIR